MKIAFFFMVLLALSTATIGVLSIASSISLSVPTGQMLEVMSYAEFNDVEPNGDPVDGSGGPPGRN